MKSTHFLILFLIILSGCNIKDVSLHSDAEWAFPLINGNIKATNLIRESTSDAELIISQDGSLTLKYTGEVLQLTKRDIFTPIPGGIPIPMLDTLVQITLPNVNNVIIKRSVLNQGNYMISYSHTRPENIKLQFWVPEMSVNNEPLLNIFDIPYKGILPVSGTSSKYSLNDIVLKPINNKITLRYIGTNEMGERFKITAGFFSFDQIDFKYIEGYIGQNVYDIKKDSIEIDFYTGISGDNATIDDPKVTMTAVNSFGFPTKALINQFVVETNTGSVNFQSPLLDAGLTFNFPKVTEAGQSKTTNYVFDKSNSNVKDIFNTQTRRVVYDIDALSNPDQVQDSTYFVTDSSKVTITVTIEFPVKGTVKQYPASKIFDVDASPLSDLEEGGLLIKTTNLIPIAADMQLYLMDKNGQVFDSVFALPQTLIMAAKTNALGVSTEATIHTQVIPIPVSKIASWSTAKSIKISAWFNSPSNNLPIIVSARDDIQIQVGFIGKLKI